METLALAAISLTIAVSIFLKKKRPPSLSAYALLCLAVFLFKAGSFLNELFPTSPAWAWIEPVGLLLVSPALANFARVTLTSQRLVTRKTVSAVSLGAAVAASAMLWPWTGELGSGFPFYLFSGTALLCTAALLLNMSRSSEVERWRNIYVAIGCAAALLIGSSDWFSYLGYGVPPLFDIAVAALIYFVLIVLVHQELPELYLIMARALVVFLLTVFGTATFFLMLKIFGRGAMPPFTTVLLASFLIVIFIDPLKIILKKVFSRMLSSEGREVLKSLYSLDDEVEKEKTVLLEEMGTVLAHEIRNPLGSIKGAAQVLRSETEDAERRKLFDVIIEESDRLNSVVSQFLSYARPFALTPRKEDMNEVVEKAISIIRMNNIARGITIETDLHPDLPAVLIDKEQIIQVILNIALNGIEAMPEGGKLVFRTSRIQSEGRESVGLSIRDTGSGMSREETRNIFKPFFTTKKRGIGLGLAVCSRIIKNHNGRIRVKSIPGQGSLFYIRLNTSP